MLTVHREGTQAMRIVARAECRRDAQKGRQEPVASRATHLVLRAKWYTCGSAGPPPPEQPEADSERVVATLRYHHRLDRSSPRRQSLAFLAAEVYVRLSQIGRASCRERV